MAIATTDRMSAAQVTSINDWRAFLERRSAARRIELPLELRLILITTTIVLALVAAGAQIASVASAQGTPSASLPLYAGATSASADYLQADGICYPALTTPQMISVQQLAAAHTPGVREMRPGAYQACQLNGLLAPDPAVGATITHGQVILVSLSQQWLWAYQDGTLVFSNPVATGRPYLRTPQGIYRVQYKRADTTFYSPWPWSSPFYYSPEHINYALNFRYGGFYIHDAPWRQMFGPGAQDPHTTPDGNVETGSHGCINMTTSAAAWLYQWANVGAAVEIVN